MMVKGRMEGEEGTSLSSHPITHWFLLASYLRVTFCSFIYAIRLESHLDHSHGACVKAMGPKINNKTFIT
jgi:hypothetical protein